MRQALSVGVRAVLGGCCIWKMTFQQGGDNDWDALSTWNRQTSERALANAKTWTERIRTAIQTRPLFQTEFPIISSLALFFFRMQATRPPKKAGQFWISVDTFGRNLALTAIGKTAYGRKRLFCVQTGESPSHCYQPQDISRHLSLGHGRTTSSPPP